MIAIETTHLFDGEAMLGHRTVLIEHGLIAAVLTHPPAGITAHALPPGTVLAPGFIDLQVNGGAGVLFNDAPSVEGLRSIAAAHLRDGTTAILPTLISGERPVIRQAIAAVRAALALGIGGIAGIHIEGPFISRARRGIHPESAIIVPTPDDIVWLSEEFPGPRLMTVAPEVVRPSQIAALAGAGYIVFLGHTDASCEAATEALDAGAAGFTHLFNAMSQFGSRTPGVVGAALASDTAVASIIADGHHAHPAAVRAAWRALGPTRLCLISDAMPSVGATHGGGFILSGRAISLVDGKLTDAAGTLAGAHLTMRGAVQGAVRLAGIPLTDALRMATVTPAAIIGLRDRGAIRPGLRADLTAIGPEFQCAGVWLAGEPVSQTSAAQTGSVSSA